MEVGIKDIPRDELAGADPCDDMISVLEGVDARLRVEVNARVDDDAGGVVVPRRDADGG